MEWWLGYLAIGAMTGFFAGMLGIGGGAIMVPLLVELFRLQEMPKSQLLHLAVGTALATILFTSISSVRAHALRGAVRWDIAKRMTPGILLGGFVGSMLAGAIPTYAVAVIFTLVIYAAATNMLIERKPRPSRRPPGAFGMSLAGFLISGLSAFAAVGGAFMSIPFMLWCGVPVIQAVGTASLIGFPIALAGSVGFMLSGFGTEGLPAYSVGYIYLPAMAAIVVASMLAAPLGAAVAHRTPSRRLKQVFAVVFYLIGTRMLVSLW